MSEVWDGNNGDTDNEDTIIGRSSVSEVSQADEATIIGGVGEAQDFDDTVLNGLNSRDDDTVLGQRVPKAADVDAFDDTVLGQRVRKAANVDAFDDTVLGQRPVEAAHDNAHDNVDETVLNNRADDTILNPGGRADSDDTILNVVPWADPDDTIIGRPVSDQGDETISTGGGATPAPRAAQPFSSNALPPLPPLPPMPTAASRPAPQFFASLALPDGRVIPVEGVVLIGRKPRSERIISGVLPTLVPVASPEGVVSSTHLEVRHEGSAVLVTDVGSSNGTALIIPGQPPRRLRAGEPTVVIPGTLLDLGDGVVLRVQPFERGEMR